MTKVQIREDPARADIREEAAALAAELRKRPGVEVDVADGRPGELAVNIDGREVAHIEGEAWMCAMHAVEIRGDPGRADIREEAARLAAELRKEPGVLVDVVDGRPGELAVRVDGREVARTGGDRMAGAAEAVKAKAMAEIRDLDSKEMDRVEGGGSNSICPRGWKLPRSDDFTSLVGVLNHWGNSNIR